ncbi:DUF3667 domain-containing protein [Caulobacter sp. S45]|uniref:DUF3667 domain-containing protein n=1 Tax=Caulobacter sp. S45 TaxID=1641861 RepID=UPI00131AAA16|nr:DUF3667 domain-containing protein [Caulobacter sp. S45]
MSKELEFAAADSVAALTRRGRAAKPSHTHTECLNCDAPLQGPYCYDCGQNADDHHRSIVHLIWEAIEGFTHLDGRLARTLPALLLRPGKLARDHIEGRRTRHVPPFRLFLICLLLFMFALEAVVHREIGEGRHTPAQNAAAGASMQKARTSLARTVVTHAADKVEHVSKGSVKVEVMDSAQIQSTLARNPPHDPLGRWMSEHIGRAVQNHEFYLMLVFEWAHRLAVLMLPILAGLLTVLYVYKRQFYVYDHLVVSMQYMSFCFLLWAFVAILPKPLNGWLFWPALAWTPVNLFMTLRGAYGSSRVGAAGKALFLWLATLFLFSVLLVGLLALALNQV